MSDKPSIAEKQLQKKSIPSTPEQNTIEPDVVEILGALPKEKQKTFLSMVCSRIGAVHKQSLQFVWSDSIVPLWMDISFQNP